MCGGCLAGCQASHGRPLACGGCVAGCTGPWRPPLLPIHSCPDLVGVWPAARSAIKTTTRFWWLRGWLSPPLKATTLFAPVHQTKPLSCVRLVHRTRTDKQKLPLLQIGPTPDTPRFPRWASQWTGQKLRTMLCLEMMQTRGK